MKGREMKEKYLVLSNRFTIKGSKTEHILLDLVEGTRYDIDPSQFDLLCLCDGTLKFSEILAFYNSKLLASKFIENLIGINAIKFIGRKNKRELNIIPVDSPRLQSVHLEASSKCNMKCAHCYQGNFYPPSNNLSVQEIFRVIEEMERMQVENISISGGEPLVDPNTFQIIRYAELCDIRISAIFTNGLLIDEEIIKKILLCRSHPTIFVSLDAITGEGMKFRGFDKRNGKAAIEKIIKNIKSLVANKIRVVVNTVMHRYNVKDLKGMYNIIRDLNVQSWRIGFPKKTGNFKDQNKFEVPWEIMADASLKILEHHLKEGKPFHLQLEYIYREELLNNFKLISGNDFVCDYEGRREGCCIKPNGDVVSCAYCNEIPIGNIRKNILKDIWHSSCMRKIKEIYAENVKECRECQLRSYCATGCRANAYFLHGDFFNAKDDYACRATAFFVSEVIPFLVKENAIIKDMIPNI